MPFTEELVRPPTPAAVSSSNTAAWSSSETSVLSAGSPVLQPMDFLDATEDHGTPLLEDLPDCPTPSQLDRVMFSSACNIGSRWLDATFLVDLFSPTFQCFTRY